MSYRNRDEGEGEMSHDTAAFLHNTETINPNYCEIISQWGTRPTTAHQVASLLRETFTLLDKVGGALSGPWGCMMGDPAPTTPFTNVSGMNDNEFLRFVENAHTEDRPDRGFTQSLVRGDLSTADGWRERDWASISFGVGTRHGLWKGEYFTLSGDRKQPAASITMREQASRLVVGLARIWRPDFSSFQDAELGDLQHGHWLAWHARMTLDRWPMWGYVSYLSDRVAQDLERYVRGASVKRFGTGWILVTDSQDQRMLPGYGAGWRGNGV